MKELYIEVFTDVGLDGKCSVPLESLIVLFGLKFCDQPPILLTLVIAGRSERLAFDVYLTSMLFEVIEVRDLPSPADLCKLPIMVMHEATTAVAGICGVLRQIFKSIDPLHPFLGFKQSCLYACAETSVWTRFCEIDALEMVKDIMNANDTNVYIPKHAARFETHMAQPVRAHNIQKVKQDMVVASGGSRGSIPDSRLQIAPDIEHLFSEGALPSIADIILFPCFHVLFQVVGTDILKWHLPLTFQWYGRMLEIDFLDSAMKMIEVKPMSGGHLNCIVPVVPTESLYKSDPRRYKPREQVFTRQDEIDDCLQMVENVSLDMLQALPFGADVAFDWGSVPFHARPEGGDLPVKRADKKSEQLENLARAVLKIARNGDRIVDFCTGSGHLGLILAHFLPRCTVILLDNKEESLNRARARTKKLQLGNVLFCQSNIDYFSGKLNVGVSLHACGVATDLVMEYCLKEEAAFVCCPCCYGSVQPNHKLEYPRSVLMKNLLPSQRGYFVLGHAADQTHGNGNSKTPQGITCMNLIDADRCFKARESGYWVSLSKLMPPSCTPKNNLLVGLPGTYDRASRGII